MADCTCKGNGWLAEGEHYTYCPCNYTEDLIYRLRKRAEIRRQITTRKSVQEGKPDRISDLLEEAAQELEKFQAIKVKLERGDHTL